MARLSLGPGLLWLGPGDGRGRDILGPGRLGSGSVRVLDSGARLGGASRIFVILKNFLSTGLVKLIPVVSLFIYFKVF